jgi:hypothetical protein
MAFQGIQGSEAESAAFAEGEGYDTFFFEKYVDEDRAAEDDAEYEEEDSFDNGYYF